MKNLLGHIKTTIKNIDFLELGKRMLAGIAIALTLTMPFSTFADISTTPGQSCAGFGGNFNCTTTTPQSLLITVINILLGVAFLVAVLFLIIGGFRYIFSAGNEETAEKGRSTVINALIGIAIIILSYIIVQVVSRTVTSGNSSF